jgi:hypothetical protein
MNVVETLVFALLTVLLFLFGRFLSKYLGVAGWLVFIVPAGSFWLFVSFGIVRSTYIGIKHSLLSRPVCRAGKCSSRQYVLVESRVDGALFRCRCGDLYLACGDSFLSLLPDSSKQLYMIKNSSGTWEVPAGL